MTTATHKPTFYVPITTKIYKLITLVYQYVVDCELAATMTMRL